MAAINIEGRIERISDSVQVSEKFTKRNFVINTEGQYPDKFEMQFTQDKVSILDKYKEGDLVEVGVNIRGREWANPSTGEIKHFVSLDAWSIRLKDNREHANRLSEDPLQNKGNGGIENNLKEDAINELLEEDDLPF